MCIPTSEQPVAGDVESVSDLETEIDGFVQMQSQFGMHLFNRFDLSRDRLANCLSRAFGTELLANSTTEVCRLEKPA